MKLWKEGVTLEKIKLKLIIIALAASLLTFLSQGSLAYYSTAGTAENVVTSGNVKLMIHETTDQGTEFPKEGVYIVPGDIVSKEVHIENICEHPFYLRVKMVYGVNSEELSSEDCFKLNINEKYWKYSDGWYYYQGILQPAEMSPEVFSHVEIVGSKVDNRYIGKTLTMTVKAQGVQSENNPVKDGHYELVGGWPRED